MAVQLGARATPDVVAALPTWLKGVQCLGSPTGEDCGYCWVHHAPTRLEL
jgi:hypothetical protein